MKNLVAAVAAFFCIALAAPASAGIITYTYTGTLTQHIASSPDAVIEGLGPFAVGSTATLTFMHDTSKGSDFPSPTQLANIGTDNLAFSFSINGNTYAGPTGFASVSGAVFIDANAGQSDIVNRLSFSNPPLGAPTGTLYQAYDVAADPCQQVESSESRPAEKLLSYRADDRQHIHIHGQMNDSDVDEGCRQEPPPLAMSRQRSVIRAPVDQVLHQRAQRRHTRHQHQNEHNHIHSNESERDRHRRFTRIHEAAVRLVSLRRMSVVLQWE